ncbi:MAG: metalloregulator ArsR/SmtB family transcription factor [Thermoanaerobaculales bacterium]|jgi:DNA-binding transcriptional ArsR family regulator|nr:metalloregulator ArsR/SmtB family transcription factor [Thermoanaerobaculales bacterium]
MMDRDLDSAVAAARALGHPARLRAVAMLRGGELCVCQVTEVLKLATSTVSLHLRELKRCGLVTERKDGRWVYVGLSDDLTAREWVRVAIAAAGDEPQLEADERLVEQLRRVPVEDLCRLGYDGALARAASGSTRGPNRRASGECR